MPKLNSYLQIESQALIHECSRTRNQRFNQRKMSNCGETITNRKLGKIKQNRKNSPVHQVLPMTSFRAFLVHAMMFYLRLTSITNGGQHPQIHLVTIKQSNTLTG